MKLCPRTYELISCISTVVIAAKAGMTTVEGVRGRHISSLASVVFVLSLFASLLCASEVRAEAAVGSEAGAFIAATRDGKAFDLSALKGKVVLISFWTTGCPACREELPMFEAIWRTYRSRGLEMLAVNADTHRTRKDVKNVAKYFSFPIAMMDAIKKNELSTVEWIPMTFVIGKDGKVSNILSDPEEWTEKDLRDELDVLLDAKVPPKIEEAEKTGDEKK